MASLISITTNLKAMIFYDTFSKYSDTAMLSVMVSSSFIRCIDTNVVIGTYTY